VDNETVLTGEKGVLILRPETGEVVLETVDGRTQHHSFGGPWAPGPQDSGVIAEFLSALTDHRAPLVTGEDGRRALEVVEATLASAATGSWVEVNHG
jgi:predicted dehydrogenase